MLRLYRVGAFLILSILLGVHSAHAQSYLAPSIGVVFGNPSAEGRANFGADLGWLSPRDPIGVDLDVVYAPSFFGNGGPYGDNSVTTVMANVMFAPGVESRYGFRRRGRGALVRPYVSAGAGVMHEVITTPGQVSNTDLGVNFGIGAMTVSRRSFGVRGDLRYFRDLVDRQSGNRTTIDFGAFHFWRASLGLVLAF
jgi:hypothetical protein